MAKEVKDIGDNKQKSDLEQIREFLDKLDKEELEKAKREIIAYRKRTGDYTAFWIL